MTREDLEKFKSTILGWITSAGGGAGPFAPSPHDLSSAHHTGGISDAQHGSRTNANAHPHSSLSGVGANDHHAQQHALDSPDHTGALGIGQLPAAAITESDAASDTPVETDANLSGHPGSIVSRFSRPDHRHAWNKAADILWTGLHTFRGLLTTHHIVPETGETYDIGTVEKRYRTLRVGELAATLFSKEQIVIVGGKMLVTKNAGVISGLIETSSTWINLGQLGLATGDFILISSEDFYGNPGVEWIRIDSGVLELPNVYDVTRNVDGSGANKWAEGTPYVVIGNDGDYRVEIEAGAEPNITIIRQGTTWNANLVTAKLGKNGVLVADSNYGDGANFVIKDESGNDLWSIARNYAGGNMLMKGNITFGWPASPAPGAHGGTRVDTNGNFTVPASSKLSFSGNTVPAPNSSIEIKASIASAGGPGHGVAFRTEAAALAPVFLNAPYAPIQSLPMLRAAWFPRTNTGNLIPDATGMGQHLTSGTGPGQHVVQTNSQLPAIGAFTWSAGVYATRADANLLTTNYFSYGGWFYIDPNAAAVQGLMAQGGDSYAKRQSFLVFSGGKVNFYIWDAAGGAQREVTGPTLSVAGWHYVGCTYAANVLWYLYVDGVMYSGTAVYGNLRASATTFDIGRLDGNTYPHLGRFEQGFFSTPHLEPGQHQAVWESGRGYKNI